MLRFICRTLIHNDDSFSVDNSTKDNDLYEQTCK